MPFTDTDRPAAGTGVMYAGQSNWIPYGASGVVANQDDSPMLSVFLDATSTVARIESSHLEPLANTRDILPLIAAAPAAAAEGAAIIEETEEIGFPVTDAPAPHGMHYLASLVDCGQRTTMDWEGGFYTDDGSLMNARFATPAAALAAGLRAVPAAGVVQGLRAGLEVRIWPEATCSSWQIEQEWWITGQAESGGMEPGSWPYQICYGPGNTVASGIQDPNTAHLLRSARDLRDALALCMEALARVGQEHGAGMGRGAGGDAAAAICTAARQAGLRAIRLSKGFAHLTEADLVEDSDPATE